MKKETDRQRIWLIIAYCFNMDGRAASQTITDKLPHLARQGITPVIISATTGRRDTHWEHYQHLSPAPSGLRYELRHLIKNRVRSAKLRLLFKIMLTLFVAPFYLLEKAFLRLNSQWSWFVPAYWRGRLLLRKHRPELIYATGGPDAAFLAACLLSRHSGIPWMAEVHDPMVEEPPRRGWLSQRWTAWLEGLIATHASAAFWFTENALARAQARHPRLVERGHTILPGVTPPDFADARHQTTEVMHFAHFGSLSATRNLSLFFAALAAALQARQAMRARLRVDIYGATLDAISRQAMHTHDLTDLVVEHGRLEADPLSGKSGRQQVLEAMRQADVLLLLHGTLASCAEYIPSKLYEYFWTARPILAATHCNPQLDALLQERGHHPVAATDVQALQQAIVALMEDWQRDGLPDLPTPQPLSVAQAVDAMLAVVNRDICP